MYGRALIFFEDIPGLPVPPGPPGPPGGIPIGGFALPAGGRPCAGGGDDPGPGIPGGGFGGEDILFGPF